MENEPPYIPFYRPYGMSEEEYASEVAQAEQRYAEWEYEQYLSEQLKITPHDNQ